MNGLNVVMMPLHFDSPNIKFSPQELREIGLEINKDFMPIYETPAVGTKMADGLGKLSAKDLLEISEEISREFKPGFLTYATKLVLLPIDPGHLYVYWQGIKQRSDGLSNPVKPAPQLTLRLFEHHNTDQPLLWCDIPVSHNQTQHNIHVPVLKSAIIYSAILGEQSNEGRFIAVADSSAVKIQQHCSAIHPNVVSAIPLQATLKNAIKHKSGLGICRTLQ